MPSLITNHLSEPVTLLPSDSSPYEPPHRSSHEKPGRRSSSTTGTVLNGFAVDGSGANKKIDGVCFQGPKGVNSSLESLPNGRESDSTDEWRKTHSRQGSELSTSSGGNGATVTEERAPLTNNGLEQRMAANESTSQVNGTTSQASRPESPLKGQSSSGHRGHTRAHSLSAPQSHTPNLACPTSDEAPTSTSNTTTKSPYNSKPIERKPVPTNPSNTAPTAPGHSRTTLQPVAPKLQHRHTLQVPRLAAVRTSRDFSSPVKTSTEDADGDIERFSPTHAGGRGSTSLARRPTRSIHSDMYLDEIPQDGDMARWTETIRQKRASRRQRKEEEEDDRVVVGTKVDMHHVNWVTAYNMLTGIRFTVSRTNAKIDRELTDADFDARHKFSFDM